MKHTWVLEWRWSIWLWGSGLCTPEGQSGPGAFWPSERRPFFFFFFFCVPDAPAISYDNRARPRPLTGPPEYRKSLLKQREKFNRYSMFLKNSPIIPEVTFCKNEMPTTIRIQEWNILPIVINHMGIRKRNVGQWKCMKMKGYEALADLGILMKIKLLLEREKYLMISWSKEKNIRVIIRRGRWTNQRLMFTYNRLWHNHPHMANAYDVWLCINLVRNHRKLYCRQINIALQPRHGADWSTVSLWIFFYRPWEHV